MSFKSCWLLWTLGIGFLVFSAGGCAFTTPQNEMDPREPDAIDGDDGRCVEEAFASNLQCGADREVTPQGCESNQVRCAFLCFDAKQGSAVCPEGKVPTADSCDPGLIRCKSTDCKPESDTSLLCGEGKEVSPKGCPPGFVQCSDY